MTTDFNAKLAELLKEPRHELPDISEQAIYVTNSNGDPNNPKAWIDFANGKHAYRIIEHLNPHGHNALSHQVIDYAGSSVLKGDVGGYTFTNGGLGHSPGGSSTNDGTLVNCSSLDPNHGCHRSKVDIINAQGGNDIVYGYSGNDQLYGDDGHDILYGGTGNDLIEGGSGTDFLFGESGADTLRGGTGDDYMAGGTENDTLYGESGDDLMFGEDGNDSLDGGAGEDVLIGGAGNDTLNGGIGNDTLVGGVGGDTLIGGDGIDLASYASSAGPVVANMADNSANTGDATGDTYDVSVEGLVGSVDGDTLTGNGGDNVIIGGAGADVLDGGAGFDMADYSTSSQGVFVSLKAGAGNGGDAAGDTLVNFEGITGSMHNDSLVGDSGDNKLIGGFGDDVLVGKSGADILDGGAGVDFAVYRSSTAAVNIDLAQGAATGGDAEGDTFINVEGVVGSNFNDTIRGTIYNNHLSGGAGDDALYGGDGNDTLAGGAGADTLSGGNGIDRLDYSDSSAAVTVNLANGGAEGGDAQGDIISGFEEVAGSAFNDILSGSAANNRLFGQGGNDNILAGAGDDTVLGGAGDDMLAGEAGSDVLAGEAGNDYYLFGDGSGLDVVVETIGGGNDTAYFTNIDANEIGIYKQGNDLLIAANGAADIMKFQNWYCTDGSYSVESFYFAPSQSLFTADQVSAVTQVLPAASSVMA